jgi:transposase
MPVTYLVEDNAPAHQTAQAVDDVERKERGIITLNWPSKSPDLNSIENVWDYEKDEISTYQFTGASKATVAEAKAMLEQVWINLSRLYRLAMPLVPCKARACDIARRWEELQWVGRLGSKQALD